MLNKKIKNNIAITRGQKKDIEDIFQIEKSSFQNPWSKESILEDISFEDRSYYFLISENRNLLGYISIWLIENEISINNVAIYKEHRGKGHGKLLMDRVFELGKDRGVKKYILEVRESNLQAIELYKKTGFQIIGKRKQFYSDGETAFIMSKDGL